VAVQVESAFQLLPIANDLRIWQPLDEHDPLRLKVCDPLGEGVVQTGDMPLLLPPDACAL